MRGCTSISRVALLAFLLALPAFAAEGGSGKGSKADEPYSDEILSGPFSEYGEFDSAEDEAQDERFFQYGRFFGVGLGVGFTSATGNAGKIYQGGFPTVDFRLHYWFDFNFALSIGIQNSKHNYDIEPDGLTDVNLMRVMFLVRYYFDTRDLSAPITFVGPHLLFGGGYFSRTDNIGSGTGDSTTGESVQAESTFGFTAGAGLELTLKPKRTFLTIDGMIHVTQFADQFDTKFQNAGIEDRSGSWLTGTISIMWTW
jgi:hypothetical protein